MSQSVPGGTVSGATRPEAGGTVSGATRPASGASSRADAVDVLVIDDHEIVSMGVRQALESGPIRAEVRWTASLTPVIRLSPGTVAVLDLRLDDGSSPAANIAHLHAHGIPVVIYTSGDEPVLIREAIAAGALSIVRKASPARHLVEAIAAALQGRGGARRGSAAGVGAEGPDRNRQPAEGEAQGVHTEAG
ncbi:response regulator transcription factor, partial [Propionibacterium sp.]|uniref:response regulator n=1 Tax=Propionibacterium sp. TaxID=1977903 RepID=UPI0039EB53A5